MKLVARLEPHVKGLDFVPEARRVVRELLAIAR
jgi:hypothetical protein